MEDKTTSTANNGKNTASKIASIIGIILCVIFGVLLVCNLIIIIKGTVKPETPPSIFGVVPMVVLTGSMSGTAPDHIEMGDLIFVKSCDVNKLKKDDVISFMEESSTATVTHRIIEVTEGEEGQLLFRTKGDANNVEDEVLVSADRVVGQYFGKRIPKLGNFALFLQKPLGMAIFIGVPLFAYIIYDILRRQHYAKREKDSADAAQEELERLRAMLEKQNAGNTQNTGNTDKGEGNAPANPEESVLD